MSNVKLSQIEHLSYKTIKDRAPQESMLIKISMHITNIIILMLYTNMHILMYILTLMFYHY